MLHTQKLITLDEKLTIGMKAHEAVVAGDSEGYSRIIKQAPMLPCLARIAKEKMGFAARGKEQ
jgi:hypothetical protein